MYRFGLLPPGTYVVQAQLEGLSASPVSVRIESGQRRSQDLRMTGAAETITVVAEAPLVNKYDVGTTSTVEAEVVSELVFSAAPDTTPTVRAASRNRSSCAPTSRRKSRW